MEDQAFKIKVDTEIGTLKSLLVHSPDSGLGKVVPSKAQDWLFEDIIHLDTVRRKEYDVYLKVLMYFIDPGRIKGRLNEVSSKERSFFIPEHEEFHASQKVIEIQNLLSDILTVPEVCQKLVSSICAIEACTYQVQENLLQSSSAELSKLLISGALPDGTMIFPPVPNFIFTRDLGITVNDHILLNKPAKAARSRETLIAKYIFFNHPLFSAYKDRIIELPENAQYFLRPGEAEMEKATLEGGDVMMVSRDHIVIGCSERTSISGASSAIKILFEKNVVRKATLVKIPHKRDFMHLDTILTQVSRNVWAVLDSITAPAKTVQHEILDHLTQKHNKDKPEIIQFRNGAFQNPVTYHCIQDLLIDISESDLGSKEKTRFIYSGNREFPYDAREQWTDSCNLLAVKEGVVIGYDRNDKTEQSFKDNGFTVIRAEELIEKFELNELDPQEITNTLILIPSAELSRARGGFHCMSMPLYRDGV